MPDYEDLILQRQEYYEILEDDPDTWIITPDEFMDIWEDEPDSAEALIGRCWWDYIPDNEFTEVNNGY